MKKITPLVTICMPAYNHEEYIQEAIQNIINQSYSNIEFIIINDNSTDKTHDKIMELYNLCEKTFFNFIYINKNKNQGLSYNCNKALQICKGDYFKVVASDDIHFKDSIETLTSFLENNIHFSACYSGYQRINDNNEVISQVLPKEHELSFYKIIMGDYKESFISYLYRTEDLKEIGGYIPGILLDDWELALRITYNNKRAYFIKDILFSHRIHDNNLHQQTQKMIQARYDALSLYKKANIYSKALLHWQRKFQQLPNNIEDTLFILLKKNPLGEDLLTSKGTKKALIFGKGTFGIPLKKIIAKNFIGFIDSQTKKINLKYDYIIISALGREEAIVQYLKKQFSISENNIIII